MFGGSTSSKSTTNLNAEGAQWLNPLKRKGWGLLNSAPGYYDFDTVAGLNPTLQGGIDALSNPNDIASRLYGAGNQGLDLLGQYYGNTVAAPQVTNQDISNFYNSDLVNQQVAGATGSAQQFLDRYLGNDIASAAAATGNSGSSRRAVMEGVAIGDAATGLANTVAGIQNNAYGQALNMAQNNANLQAGNNALNANNMSNYMSFTGNNLGNAYNMLGTDAARQIDAGNILRQYDQDLIADQMNEHMWDYNQGWQAANNYAGISSPAWGLTTTKTKASQKPSTASMIAGAAGIAAGAMTGNPFAAAPVSNMATGSPLPSFTTPISSYAANNPGSIYDRFYSNPWGNY